MSGETESMSSDHDRQSEEEETEPKGGAPEASAFD